MQFGQSSHALDEIQTEDIKPIPLRILFVVTITISEGGFHVHKQMMCVQVSPPAFLIPFMPRDTQWTLQGTGSNIITQQRPLEITDRRIDANILTEVPVPFILLRPFVSAERDKMIRGLERDLLLGQNIFQRIEVFPCVADWPRPVGAFDLYPFISLRGRATIPADFWVEHRGPDERVGGERCRNIEECPGINRKAVGGVRRFLLCPFDPRIEAY